MILTTPTTLPVIAGSNNPCERYWALALSRRGYGCMILGLEPAEQHAARSLILLEALLDELLLSDRLRG